MGLLRPTAGVAVGGQGPAAGGGGGGPPRGGRAVGVRLRFAGVAVWGHGASDARASARIRLLNCPHAGSVNMSVGVAESPSPRGRANTPCGVEAGWLPGLCGRINRAGVCLKRSKLTVVGGVGERHHFFTPRFWRGRRGASRAYSARAGGLRPHGVWKEAREPRISAKVIGVGGRLVDSPCGVVQDIDQ